MQALPWSVSSPPCRLRPTGTCVPSYRFGSALYILFRQTAMANVIEDQTYSFIDARSDYVNLLAVLMGKQASGPKAAQLQRRTVTGLDTFIHRPPLVAPSLLLLSTRQYQCE